MASFGLGRERRLGGEADKVCPEPELSYARGDEGSEGVIAPGVSGTLGGALDGACVGNSAARYINDDLTPPIWARTTYLRRRRYSGQISGSYG